MAFEFQLWNNYVMSYFFILISSITYYGQDTLGKGSTHRRCSGAHHRDRDSPGEGETTPNLSFHEKERPQVTGREEGIWDDFYNVFIKQCVINLMRQAHKKLWEVREEMLIETVFTHSNCIMVFLRVFFRAFKLVLYRLLLKMPAEPHLKLAHF